MSPMSNQSNIDRSCRNHHKESHVFVFFPGCYRVIVIDDVSATYFQEFPGFPVFGISLRLTKHQPKKLNQPIACLIWQCVKTLYPCSSHQNSWVKMDVHPTKNGINRYWSIPIWKNTIYCYPLMVWKLSFSRSSWKHGFFDGWWLWKDENGS